MGVAMIVDVGVAGGVAGCDTGEDGGCCTGAGGLGLGLGLGAEGGDGVAAAGAGVGAELPTGITSCPNRPAGLSITTNPQLYFSHLIQQIGQLLASTQAAGHAYTTTGKLTPVAQAAT